MKRRTLMMLGVAGALAGGAIGCGSGAKYDARGTPQAPGADAEIIVTPLESDNFKVKIDAEYLPPPERVAADATVYVVWVIAADNDVVKLGSLPLEGDREAEMFGTTVARQFEVVVTAERDLDAETPSPSVILRQTANL